MISGTTSTGFEFEIDSDVLHDMEFIELLAESEKDGTKLAPAIVNAIGEKQKKALWNHCRNVKGRVPIERVSQEFMEILEASKDPDSKN